MSHRYNPPLTRRFLLFSVVSLFILTVIILFDKPFWKKLIQDPSSYNELPGELTDISRGFSHQVTDGSKDIVIEMDLERMSPVNTEIHQIARIAVTRTERLPATRTIIKRDFTPTITAQLIPSGLPRPWPLGVLSVSVSIVSSINSLRRSGPPSGVTYFWWSFTILRAAFSGITAIVQLLDHTEPAKITSSDGCIAMFAAVTAVILSSAFWARTALLPSQRRTCRLFFALSAFAMFFGYIPLAVQVVRRWTSPVPTFSFNNTQCIVSDDISCSTFTTIPGCHAPIVDNKGTTLNAVDDDVRFIFMMCVAFYCLVGGWIAATSAAGVMRS